MLPRPSSRRTDETRDAAKRRKREGGICVPRVTEDDDLEQGALARRHGAAACVRLRARVWNCGPAGARLPGPREGGVRERSIDRARERGSQNRPSPRVPLRSPIGGVRPARSINRVRLDRDPRNARRDQAARPPAPPGSSSAARPPRFLSIARGWGRTRASRRALSVAPTSSSSSLAPRSSRAHLPPSPPPFARAHAARALLPPPARPPLRRWPPHAPSWRRRPRSCTAAAATRAA